MGAANITYRDVLGLEQSIPGELVRETVRQPAQMLAQEIAQRVTALNGGAPSALFLAGGGSKLEGLRDLVAEALEMEENRVALAGNNYEMTAFSDSYELNDPELATPLGIAVSAGLGLISDSYRIMLNGKPAKLFRSGALTVLELLMMNGYSSIDLLGRTGKSLSVTVDGQRMLFRGEPASPCVLLLNGTEAVPSAVVYAGDSIEFTPAVSGVPAQKTVKDLLGADFTGGVTVNGRLVDLDTRLSTGDQIVTSTRPVRPAHRPEYPKAEPQRQTVPPAVRPEREAPKAESPLSPNVKPAEAFAVPLEAPRIAPTPAEVHPAQSDFREKTAPPADRESKTGPSLQVMLNGKALILPGKPEGVPYYVMDLLEHSGIDFEHLDRGVELQVNGQECAFSQELRAQDNVVIQYLE